MNLGICKPCSDRGRKRPASTNVAGTPMCEPCFTGKEPAFVVDVIEEASAPLGSLADLIHEALARLKAAPPGMMLKITVTGYSVARVQKNFWSCAEKAGMKVQTATVEKVLYIRRLSSPAVRLTKVHPLRSANWGTSPQKEQA